MSLKRALPKEARVVCMGVRRGLELFAWEWKGYQNVVGVELDPRRELGNIITADFSHLESIFPDSSCDLIYSCASFKNCYDPVRTAQEWKRILKPNGVLWLSLPTALGQGYAANEIDPVIINRVADLETLFDPLRAVWLTTKGSGAGVIGMNVVLLNPDERTPAPSARVLRETRRAIRAGVWLSRLVRTLASLRRRIGGAQDRDYSFDICLRIERLRSFLHGNNHQAFITTLRSKL